MSAKEKYSKIKEFFWRLGPVQNKKGLAIGLLYMDYTSRFGGGDKKLEEYVRTQAHNYSFKPFSDITEAECKSFFKTVSLDKEEYPEIVLDLLSTGDQYDGISNPSLVELVARVLEIKSSDSVFDLGSGYGNFLVAVGYFNRDQAIRPALYGQEINIDAYNISCMALTMCGANYHIQNINSIESTKCPAFTKGYVFPPFAIRFDRSASNQFKFLGEELFVPKTSSEWLFVFKALEGMSKTGKLAVLLPEGTLFKAPDAGIRKYLLDNNLIEGIISLPSGVLYPWASVKTSLVVLSYGNEAFKVVNGEEVLKGLPVKGLASHEAAVDLYNAYNSKDVEIIKDSDIKSLDFNLSYNVLHAKDVYQGLHNLKAISEVAEVLKGSPLTISSFKDQIASSATPYQILTSSNIEDGIIDYESLPYIGDGKKYEKFFAKKGDVVMTTKSTKVKFAVINEEPSTSVIVTGGMIIIRPNTDLIDGTYLKMFFDSAKGKAVLASIQKGAIITTIPFNDFKNLKFPCPSIEDQKAVSKKYNNLLAVYDGMKKEVKDMERRLANFYEDSLGD